jgi:hypothetical protein
MVKPAKIAMRMTGVMAAEKRIAKAFAARYWFELSLMRSVS